MEKVTTVVPYEPGDVFKLDNRPGRPTLWVEVCWVDRIDCTMGVQILSEVPQSGQGDS